MEGPCWHPLPMLVLLDEVAVFHFVSSHPWTAAASHLLCTQHGFEDHEFIPLILPNSISEDEKAVALETVRGMKLKHVDLIDEK